MSVCGRDTAVNLMSLEMSDYDVILGMDWLALCHAMVDIHEKAVKFNVSGDQLLYFKVTIAKCQIISSLCLVDDNY